MSRKSHVANDSRVLWLCNMASKIRLALLNGLMCVTNAPANLFKIVWSHFRDYVPGEFFFWADFQLRKFFL